MNHCRNIVDHKDYFDHIYERRKNITYKKSKQVYLVFEFWINFRLFEPNRSRCKAVPIKELVV